MPDFYLMGGPNGAGKTTIAMRLLPAWGCHEFVNADALAGALAPFAPESMALQAGVLMMRRLRELAAKEVSFGTESTLAARAFVPFIQECRNRGYGFKLCYIWLPSVEAAVARVAARVRAGGHAIPEATIRRRYEAGRRNFWQLYAPLADQWVVLDNSQNDFTIVAEGGREVELEVRQMATWRQIIA